MLVVQKYGGTSVGTPARIRAVADRIARRRRSGDRVVVVVSAMGETTDRLKDLAREVTDHPSRRELDMLLTAGERISMALLSMALHARRVDAISFTGSQSGIITDTAHTQARIVDIRPVRIGPELDRGRVVIVAGFQGVSPAKEVTTLGRGGSDTSAVALAAGLGADACEIYTDVPGVMTADPRIVSGARLIRRLDWDTMTELASRGAGVVHPRAAALAGRRRLPYQVRSSFTQEEGTMVAENPYEPTGVVAVTGRGRLVEAMIPVADGRLADFYEDLAATVASPLDLDHHDGTVRFRVADEADLVVRLAGLASRHDTRATVTPGLAAVTLVGDTAARPALLSARGHRVLEEAGIPVRSVHLNPRSLSFIVSADDYERAQQLLHEALIEEGTPS